jgi:HlyD family secretion protein
VGGGTVLLKMADLNLVQVSALVDETDIGKIQPGLRTTVTVDAFPNRQFDGRVLKIEPQATISQNVTMFPVLIRIDNHEGLLRPGMNTEVQIHVGRRDSVLAVPNTALRTQKDMAGAADVLGLSLAEVQTQLAQAKPVPSDSAQSQPVAAAAGVHTITLPNGRAVPLPAGVTEQQVQTIFRKRMSGEEPPAEERALLRKLFQAGGGGGLGAGGGGRGGGEGARQGSDQRSGGRFVVFVRRHGQPFAVNVTTGLTDLDYSEVLSGLTESDSVLILPSASLIQSQKEMTQRVQRVTGGGIPGMNAQGQSGGKPPATTPPRP